MNPVLGLLSRDDTLPRAFSAPLADRYSIIGKLRSAGRAELFVALPRLARGSGDVVVIKTFDIAPGADGAGAEAQLELASGPAHENLIRVLECGWDMGRPFIVSEYVEGTTLRRMLSWLEDVGQKLPDTATARILVGLFAAVEHAAASAHTLQARALAWRPIDATNVLITSQGDVKVLGFKSPDGGTLGRWPSSYSEPVAIDDLLSKQRGPAIRAVLARIGKLSSSDSLVGLSHVTRILKDWQRRELGSDGSAELAAAIAGVRPEERAARRRQIAAALARIVQARDGAA